MLLSTLSRLRAALLALALLLPAAPLRAQGAPASGPEPTITLLTMGPGDQVYEKFGHDAIWVHDPVAGTDWVYNWGVFDFDSPGYWGRFVKGTWIYQLAVFDIYQTLADYEYHNRWVVAQELNLTARQKRELQAFLEWNARPENREYLYDYYRDNCSTRVRDAIDRATGGALRAATAGVATGTTYRWHTRRLMAGDPAAYTGLALGLGPAADRPISAWEEMFLPEKVMERVRGVKVSDGAGRMVPLVKRESRILTAVGREPEPTRPPNWIPRYLLAGVLIAATLVGLGLAAPRSGPARFGYATLGALWSLFLGVGGVLLLALWTLTDHAIAYRNENLFQLSPLALPLVVLLPLLALRARRAAGAARALALAVGASSLLGFALQALPGLDQVNGAVIALVLPVNLALAWSVDRLARHAALRSAPAASTAPSGEGPRDRSLAASR